MFKKCQSISKKVNELRGDTKGLYKHTCNLTGVTTPNPWPEANSNEDLAEQFAEFFLDKITKIREKFADNLIYKPTASDVPRLRSFSPMTESVIIKVINRMQSKKVYPASNSNSQPVPYQRCV